MCRLALNSSEWDIIVGTFNGRYGERRMIKEFCDRCLTPVGRMQDGGKDILKYNASGVLAFIGLTRNYILCPRCTDVLKTAIDNFLSRC